MISSHQFVNYLLAQKGLGRQTVLKLYRLFPNFSDLVKHFEKQEEISDKLKRILFRALSQESKVDYENMITIWDDWYPFLLKQIPDAPVRIFYKGDLSLAHKDNCLSIVGTRKYTEYGNSLIKAIQQNLLSSDFVVVSGMAFGIDALAHKAAIDSESKTIAILGSPLDNPMPSGNYSLFQKILKEGLVLSEYPDGTKIHNGMFVERNRIIAGLSRLVIVVEAGKKSGALITAQLAHDYNREVYTFPGNFGKKSTVGNNLLILHNIANIIADLGQITAFFDDSCKNSVKNCKKEYKNCKNNNKNVKNKGLFVQKNGIFLQKRDAFYKKNASKYNNNVFFAQIYQKGPLSATDLAKLTKVSINECLEQIAALELDGVVKKSIDGKYFIE